MSAEVEEKKSLTQALLESVGIPEGILEHGLVGTLPFILLAVIGWLLKEYHKNSNELFLKGRYLEIDERIPLNKINNGDQFQHELNLKYTDRIEQFQRGEFRDLYHQSLGRLLKFIAYFTKENFHYSTAIQNPHPLSGIFTISVFSQKSFELCLKLAVLYPLAFLIISWGIGGAGKLGEFEVFGSTATLPLRWLFITELIISSFLFYKLFQARGFGNVFYQVAAGAVAGVFAVVSTGVFAGAGHIAGAVAGSVTGAGVFAVAVAGSVTGAGVFAVAVAGVGTGVFAAAVAYTFAIEGAFSAAAAVAYAFGLAVAVTVAYIAEYFYKKEYKYCWLYFCGFFMVYSMAAIVTALLDTDSSSELELIAFPLFLGVLPIVNSVVDWLSLGFTRAFLFKLYKGADSFGHTTLLAVADLLLALLFMLALIANTVGIIALVNVFSVNINGKVAFDLTAIFKSLHGGENWQDNLWIHFMMLSTLVPTLLHFVFALVGLLMPLLSPLTKDEFIELKKFKPEKLNNKIYWATIYRKPIVVLAALAIVVGICSPIYHHGEVAFDFLLSHAVNIAEFIHPEGIDREVIFAEN